jgi:CDGSH-type Zn-finger protein
VDPVVYDKKPCILELEPGTYYWCACGMSKNQPYCDGSHAGTGIEPVEFAVDKEQRVALCLCKHSKHSYKCDGSHSHLP